MPMTAPRRASSCWRGARSASVPEYFQAAELPRPRRAALERASGELVTALGGDDQGRGRRRAHDGRSPRATARSNALDTALRKALIPVFPELDGHPPHRLQGPHPDAAGRHQGGDAGDDRDRRGRRRDLVHGRRLDQRHRRLLQRAPRQPHLQAAGARAGAPEPMAGTDRRRAQDCRGGRRSSSSSRSSARISAPPRAPCSIAA